MNCPICIVPLNIAERHGVEIDFCPKCRGVWLDRGELDKIIERSMTEVPARSYQEPRYEERRDQTYDKHRNGHHGDHHLKKRGFLHDLFD
jgi:Zn-finger nucleic acid-binding protein